MATLTTVSLVPRLSPHPDELFFVGARGEPGNEARQRSNWSMLHEAIMNTSAFGVQRSMKGSTTVEELVFSKVARVGCEISLNRTEKAPFKK